MLFSVARPQMRRRGHELDAVTCGVAWTPRRERHSICASAATQIARSLSWLMMRSICVTSACARRGAVWLSNHWGQTHSGRQYASERLCCSICLGRRWTLVATVSDIAISRCVTHWSPAVVELGTTSRSPPHWLVPHPPRRSVGHKGKFGHEFMEFEFRPDGRLRYANNSNYKNDIMIRKEGASWSRACCSGQSTPRFTGAAAARVC